MKKSKPIDKHKKEAIKLIKDAKVFTLILWEPKKGDVWHYEYNASDLELIAMCESVKHKILTQHLPTEE